MNRESQPSASQEYPAMLQTLLGSGYDVRNFGDACGTVLQGYKPTSETHPYVNGPNLGDGPGYKESLAFLPDIVVIGSWGRHDWGTLAPGPGQVFTLSGFQKGLETLVQQYQALTSHPRIFISLPIPIPYGQGDVPDNGVTTSSVLPTMRAVAAQSHLPIVDLYTAFLNHKELFRQPPDADGEGEHVTDVAGLSMIAKTVYAALTAAPAPDGGASADGSPTPADSATAGAPVSSSAVLDARKSADDASPPDQSQVADVGPEGGLGGATGGATGGTTGGTTGGATGGASGSGSSSGPPVANDAAPPPSGGSASARATAQAGCSCALDRADPSSAGLAALVLGGAALASRRRRRNGHQLGGRGP